MRPPGNGQRTQYFLSCSHLLSDSVLKMPLPPVHNSQTPSSTCDPVYLSDLAERCSNEEFVGVLGDKNSCAQFVLPLTSMNVRLHLREDHGAGHRNAGTDD